MLTFDYQSLSPSSTVDPSTCSPPGRFSICGFAEKHESEILEPAKPPRGTYGRLEPSQEAATTELSLLDPDGGYVD